MGVHLHRHGIPKTKILNLPLVWPERVEKKEELLIEIKKLTIYIKWPSYVDDRAEKIAQALESIKNKAQ